MFAPDDFEESFDAWIVAQLAKEESLPKEQMNFVPDMCPDEQTVFRYEDKHGV
jgi:hypothetical protein